MERKASSKYVAVVEAEKVDRGLTFSVISL
jgi:hypothetical protein